MSYLNLFKCRLLQRFYNTKEKEDADGGNCDSCSWLFCTNSYC